jgi:hypothetical protein
MSVCFFFFPLGKHALDIAGEPPDLRLVCSALILVLVVMRIMLCLLCIPLPLFTSSLPCRLTGSRKGRPPLSFVFHPNLLWFRVIVMQSFFSVPSSCLSSISRPCPEMANSLLGMGNITCFFTSTSNCFACSRIPLVSTTWREYIVHGCQPAGQVEGE